MARKNNYCIDCGKNIWNKSKRCKSCASKGNTHGFKKGNKGYWLGKKRPKIADLIKERWKDPEYKKRVSKKISEKQKGRIPFNKNKTYEEVYGIERAKKIRKNLSKIHTERPNRYWLGKKGVTVNTGRTHFKKGHRWTGLIKEKTIKATLKGLMKRPTSFEQKICDLCLKYNLPFFYTGNGKFLVGYKNPDFKHKYLPILIEVYNDYHHPKNYEEIRGEHFAKYGYKTIFINQQEVTDENWETICLNKIEKIK